MMCMVGNLYKAAGLALAQLVKALSILSAYKMAWELLVMVHTPNLGANKS